MSKMPKTIKSAITALLLLISFSLPMSVAGKELIGVNTGPPNSASWGFVKELSAVWGLKYQDKESRFSPEHVESLYQRFVNLDQNRCRFVIAPLKSITELPISDLNVKIVLILWESYLAPITLTTEKTDIGFNTHDLWYLPEHSSMMTGFLKGLNEKYDDLSTDLSPELMTFARSVIWDDEEAFSYFESESFSQDVSVDITAFEDDWEVSEDSTDDGVFEEAQKFLTVKTINTDDLKSQFQLSPGEVLLYDMVGSSAPLLSSFDLDVSVASLTPELSSRLLMENTLLERFSFSRGNVNTVGLTFALFVHEDEDIEFVKEVIEAIYYPSKSELNNRFMFSNLRSKETKEISPLFLHNSTIEFFGID